MYIGANVAFFFSLIATIIILNILYKKNQEHNNDFSLVYLMGYKPFKINWYIVILYNLGAILLGMLLGSIIEKIQ